MALPYPSESRLEASFTRSGDVFRVSFALRKLVQAGQLARNDALGERNDLDVIWVPCALLLVA
jgi:hypothetical protein